MRNLMKNVWAFFVILGLTGGAHAAFLEPYWSARVAGLGGAYTAVSDDATGIFYNPAAGVGAGKRQMDFSYSKLLTGLDGVNLALGQVAYAQPLGASSLLGVGWGHFDAANLYREDTFLVSFSQSLKPLFPAYPGELSVGASAKMLARDFTMTDRTSGDPVFKDGSRKNAAAIDLHLYSRPVQALSFGLTVRSINRPDIGYKSEEKLPLEVTGGLLLRWRNLAFPLDVTSRNGELTPRLGTEASFLNGAFVARMGGDMHQVGMGFGCSRNISKTFAVVFDYAFILPLAVQDTTGSHRTSFGIKF